MECELMPMCDGRECKNRSVGKVHELKPKRRWKWEKERVAEFHLVTTSYYCLEHEEVAKDYLNPSECGIYQEV